MIKLHQLRPTCSHRTYYFEYKAPCKSMRTLIVMFFGLLATVSSKHQKSCLCSEVSGEGAVGQNRAAHTVGGTLTVYRGDGGIAAVSSSNSANSVKKLPQGLNYWRLLLRVFWYNWEHRGSLISLSYDLKVKTRACRALSELWACSTQTSKKSNSHKTVQGWIAYLNIKDLLSLNHLTHNHINCILKKKGSIEYSAMETRMGVKECFCSSACLKVKLVDTDALTYLATHEHTSYIFWKEHDIGVHCYLYWKWINIPFSLFWKYRHIQVYGNYAAPVAVILILIEQK